MTFAEISKGMDVSRCNFIDCSVNSEKCDHESIVSLIDELKARTFKCLKR